MASIHLFLEHRVYCLAIDYRFLSGKWNTIQSFSIPRVTSSRINFYEEAKAENFNEHELEILKPLINVLQLQYTKISASKDLSRSFEIDGGVNDDQSFIELNNLLLSIQPEFSNDSEESKFSSNDSLPSIKNLNDSLSGVLSLNEANDIQDIFQEQIDEAYQTIHNLIDLCNETEDQIRRISINKIKMVKFIYKMVQKVYALGIRAGRTAYCTYSSIPVINSTLTEGNHEILSCYNYTQTSITRLRKDVRAAIKDIRSNTQELIDIYRKLTKRHSLLGKIITIFVNIRKISKDIQESSSIAIETIEEVKTDAPIIASNTNECATVSISNLVKNLNEYLTDLNTCIKFVDDST
ncbi:uncharacterized protein LOC129942443 [Eupeodes corollae]|uniref:uncharacterized protein LOC129942443 n=1 Tax=Eupeodes corollae TaxID=290404 RepID=UPI002490020B|nr:uncharacterized protein LOC129942443 [Eupeodes corollae]